MPQSVGDVRKWAQTCIRQSAELPLAFGLTAVDTLICDLLGWTTPELFSRGEEDVTADLLIQFQSQIGRLLAGEPLAYIRGVQEFYDSQFIVDSRVLIPRPETELLVDRVLEQFIDKPERFLLIDIGVGSGAIILSVLKALRERYGSDYLANGLSLGVDIDPGPLAVSLLNARCLDLSNFVHFIRGDLMSAFHFDPKNSLSSFSRSVVVSNPPYIAQGDYIERSVRNHEPPRALFAGKEGLDIIGRLCLEIGHKLTNNTIFLLEVGAGQAPKVESLLLKAGNFSNVSIYRDLQGIERVLESCA